MVDHYENTSPLEMLRRQRFFGAHPKCGEVCYGRQRFFRRHPDCSEVCYEWGCSDPCGHRHVRGRNAS